MYMDEKEVEEGGKQALYIEVFVSKMSRSKKSRSLTDGIYRDPTKDHNRPDTHKWRLQIALGMGSACRLIQLVCREKSSSSSLK